jgi:phosphoglucosamine mutase
VASSAGTASAGRAERRLFGTDGVRGIAGEQITAELVLALARVATERAAAQGGGAPRVLVIRDTRESGDMLEAAVAAGVAAAGGEALLGGVLPTPAAPLLVRRHELQLGVVLSASHNPYRDNGIKFFDADGFKLSDAAELEIEQALEAHPVGEGGRPIGRVRRLDGALEDYVGALAERFGDLRLDGRRVLLDCANGATYRAAPAIFARLGAEVGIVAAAPDGRNINEGCGSTHVERLAAAVPDGGYELGFAFDGDGDRVLAVDRDGAVVDGDELIALAARHLGVPGVAVTVMSNFGLHAAMEQAGIEVETTPVGDRHVLRALRERGWRIGGEQSGHIIDMGFVPSGDGIAAALLALEAIGDGGFHDRHAMEKLPQRLVNVRLADRAAVGQALAQLEEDVARESAGLEGRGRVLVRASGTEPLVRVMVEAPTADEAHATCARLVATVERSTSGQ